MADQETIVICPVASALTPFSDNEYGVCSECGIDVQHRPHIPKPSRLLCLSCGLDEIELRADETGEPVEVRVTDKTMNELKAVLGRQRH